MGRRRGSDKDIKASRFDRSSGGSSDSANGKKTQNTRRSTDRDIKNGRSLSDVLGSASNRARGGLSAPNRGFEAPSDAPRPQGRKVQYQAVMSFHAPAPEKPPEKVPEKAPAKTAAGQSEIRTGSQADKSVSVAKPETNETTSPTRSFQRAGFRPVFQPPGSVPLERKAEEISGPDQLGKKAGGEKSIRPIEPVDVGWPRSRVIGTGMSESARGEARFKEARRENGRIWVTGTIKRHPDGFGFLIPEDASLPDIYISRQYMAGVMTNDRVEAEVFRARPMDRGSSGADRLFGEVKRIISRAHSRIIGRYLPVDRRYGVIQDDGRGWGMDLRISTEDSLGAHEGDWVAVEITEYASHDRPLTGRVIRILGEVEDPLNDIIRVIHEKGIPDEFSFSTRREAAALGTEVRESDIQGREDLRNLALITIDGATARDFDDAVYVETSNSGFRVVVAIADVSSYVKPASAIDEDAYSRGTSTYFPNFVVPMLPEELSNELCSLKPDVNRLCFACEMQLDFQGAIREYRFFEAVMKSKARVTYGEAQEVIDGEPSARLRALPEVCENILRCADLAKILMAKRFREGSLDLNVPETQVVVDNGGETIDVVRTERLFAHRLIEELMLLTNIATARFFEDNRIHGIYRIHEEPDPENIKTVEKMLWNLLGPGRGRLGPGVGLQKKLTKALQAAAETPGGQVLNVLTLRAMNQAKYSSENVGHFGLGFSHYSHFTSPIRRYPDLIAHRLIKAVIYPRYRNQGMEVDEIQAAATHLSSCEQRSVKAERAVISIKKARFIRRYIGETLEGSITSIAKFGIFVTLREFEIDGLVKLESLGPDRWVFDDQNMRLYGRRTGRVFKLGDVLNVVVQASDLGTGKIDFTLEDEGAQVEEALVVLGDEMDVEELAERAEQLVHPRSSRKNRSNKDLKMNRAGAGRKAKHAKASKSPHKNAEQKTGERSGPKAKNNSPNRKSPKGGRRR